MNSVSIAKKRYSSKAFQANQPFTPEILNQLESLLQLSASSVNGQPWHFFIVQSEAARARISKATEGNFTYNKTRVLHASALIVFCTRTDMDEAYLQSIIEQEAKDGRFKNEEERKMQHEKRDMYVKFKKQNNTLTEWTSLQTYLNAGAFLFAVAGMGLDALPMEGFDHQVLDAELGLAEKSLTSKLMVAVGHHSADDFNAHLPKSRLPKEQIITHL